MGDAPVLMLLDSASWLTLGSSPFGGGLCTTAAPRKEGGQSEHGEGPGACGAGTAGGTTDVPDLLCDLGPPLSLSGTRLPNTCDRKPAQGWL